jgi:soluble lytic murein transglycosylase-like protein
MNYKDLFFAMCIFAFTIIFFGSATTEKPEIEKTVTISSNEINESSLSCLKMYYAIMKWSSEYQIPKSYAFGIARKETGYQGPFHWKYKHTQTSCVGAIGPMQIMPSTADLVWKDLEVSRSQLMNDVDFNVHTSMKLLRVLYDKYGDWKIVFGCYNTGRPMINQYAIDVFNHKLMWKLNTESI